MDFIQSILMGIVQGLSEFLPISSSGHLVLTSSFYKIFKGIELVQETNQEVFFDMMLHLGTLLAVFIYFRKDICRVSKDFFLGLRTKDYSSEGFKTSLYIILGTFITALIAYPLSIYAEKLIHSPACVGILLIFTGILLITSENISKKYINKKSINLSRSIIISIAQGFASLPGFSRSGLTIAFAMLCGVDRITAARYSFLLSIPIILGASIVYPLVKIDLKEFFSFDWGIILAGTILSAIIGYLCIKYFMKFLSKFSLSLFGIYCLLMGSFTFIFFIGR